LPVRSAAFALALLAGCGMARSRLPPMEIAVRVESDPGRVVAGAEIREREQRVVTGPDGIGIVKLYGTEGTVHQLDVTCPEGLIPPKEPLTITLRRLADPTKRPEYVIVCRPAIRNIVVSVRVRGASSLPVRYLGRELSRTDEAGVAHVLVRVAPQEDISIELGTDEKGNEQLRPINPRRSFIARNADDVFVFDQTFDLERQKTAARASGPVGPQRILPRHGSQGARESTTRRAK
jgi:hypothetical protein